MSTPADNLRPTTWWTASCPTGYVDIAVGFEHACAVCDAGTVHCRGSNAYGALGGQSKEQDAGQNRQGVIVGGLRDAKEVAAGLAFGCARVQAGRVACWGWNRRGQLGRRLSPGVEWSPEPQLIAQLDAVEALAAGREHLCALRRGQVWCWGSNRYGQLGRDGGDSDEPQPVARIDDAVEIAAGLDVSCARLSTGEVACWGDNRFGALATPEVIASHEPRFASSIASAVAIATDGVRSCALLDDERVHCWGGRPHDSASAQPGHYRLASGTALLIATDQVCVRAVDSSLICAQLHQGERASEDTSLSGRGPAKAFDAVYRGPVCAVRSDSSVWCERLEEH